jgi:hypothetical protein
MVLAVIGPRRPSCVHLVLESRGAWWVDREGRTLGPCTSRHEAIEAALQVVQTFGDPGRRAEIWAPDDSGKMALVWKGKPGDKLQRE